MRKSDLLLRGSRSALTYAGIALSCLAASCARESVSEKESSDSASSLMSAGSTSDVEKMAFAQWCERWGLTCPADDKKLLIEVNDSQDESKETLQWQAISQLFERFARSGSDFSVDDSELTSAKTRLLMTQIGLHDVHSDFLEVLGKSGLKKLAVDPLGNIRFEARPTVSGQSGMVRGRSGMKWIFANNGGVSVGGKGQYLFSGLQFSAANSFESDVFGQLTYNDVDKTTWSGSNLAVTHVPDGFFIRDVPVRWEKFSDLQRVPMLAAVSEMRDLVFSGGRFIKLNPAFFDTAARNMPVFVDDAKILPAATKLVDAFGSLEFRAPSAKTSLAQLSLEKAASVMCRIEMSGTPPIELTLDRRFGVQNAYTNEKRHAQIDLYGINIKARVGIPIAFNLKRIDVEPSRIVIKGVPVIGEIAIPLPEEGKKFDKELKKFECTERI
ncbi:MAG: hypothetical protein EBR09_04050 [Proteobacteria bacterium]|nr:hypothetical protein [Pseudomonadota bacterium]